MFYNPIRVFLIYSVTTGVTLQWFMISENTLKASDLKPSMFLLTIGSRNVKRDENASASFGLLYLQKMGSTSQI
jgi:hypothetical protein